jgi:hypothetical protein
VKWEIEIRERIKSVNQNLAASIEDETGVPLSLEEQEIKEYLQQVVSRNELFVLASEYPDEDINEKTSS